MHQQNVEALHLVPVTGGRFEILVGEREVFNKKETKRFPEDGEAASILDNVLA